MAFYPNQKINDAITQLWSGHTIPAPFVQGDTAEENIQKILKNLTNLPSSGDTLAWHQVATSTITLNESSDYLYFDTDLGASMTKGAVYRFKFTCSSQSGTTWPLIEFANGVSYVYMPDPGDTLNVFVQNSDDDSSGVNAGSWAINGLLESGESYTFSYVTYQLYLGSSPLTETNLLTLPTS